MASGESLLPVKLVVVDGELVFTVKLLRRVPDMSPPAME